MKIEETVAIKKFMAQKSLRYTLFLYKVTF